MMYGCLAVFVAFCLVDVSAHVSEKKGVGIFMDGYQCGDLNALSGIHWWFNWNTEPGKARRICHDDDKGFVPMKKKGKNLSNTDHKIVLGYNSQNQNERVMSPEEAAEDMLALQTEEMYKIHGREQAGDRTLVSPVVGPDDYMEPIPWLKEFFGHCNNKTNNQCKVDRIALRAFYCDADMTMEFIENVYNEFNKKIWLTQFACGKTKLAKNQLKFMKEILPKLEKSDIVERYAWFVSRMQFDGPKVTRSSNLLYSHKSELTELGEYYNSYEPEC